jgi:membrane-associated phospholipid phosphatase
VVATRDVKDNALTSTTSLSPRVRTNHRPPLTAEDLAERFRSANFDAPGAEPEVRSRHDRQQRLFRWLVFGMFAIYIVGAIVFFVWRGQVFRPDNWALFLLVAALLLGRLGPFIRDWIPFVLLVFGYEFLRGVAGEFVTGGERVGDRPREALPDVQVESLVNFDISLMFGHEPVSTLQGWLYTPGDPKWWDYLAMIVYSLHFALPCMFAFLLWITRKERFWQFTLAFCLMTYSAFAFFLFYPAAPPWLANSWGVVSGIGWPASSVTASIGIDPIRELDTISIWQNASPHPVAAMPSLHAGFPWLILLFAVKYYRWKGLLVLPYNAALWFSVVYLANHWVVDILAGMAWATLAFVIVDWGWERLSSSHGIRLSGPVRDLVNDTNHLVVQSVASAFAPIWNAPGKARSWLFAKLTSSRKVR